MAYTLFIFLPVATCLLWLVIHYVLASRMETFPQMMLLCISCAIYLFSDACHATQPKGSLLDTGALIAALFAGPCIIPLIITYIKKISHQWHRHTLSLMWIMIPTMLFTAGLLTYLLNFEERIGLAFDYIAGPALHTVLAVELLILIIFSIRTLRNNRLLPGSIYSFIFKGKPISLARLQIDSIIPPLLVMVLRIVISDNLYTVQSWVAIASAAIITSSLFIFATNALFGTKTVVSWKDFRDLIRFNYSTDEQRHETVDRILNELLEEAEDDTLERIYNNLRGRFINNEWQPGEYEGEPMSQLAGQKIAIDTEDLEEDSLISRFQTLMTEKKLFLQPKLTLDDVAYELASNKTYVSKMVNNFYGIGFPEVINTMRVDYAEQYILLHRDAKQSEIAMNCGFISASSFNTVFKKVTGMTPKVWVASVGIK